jgi:predicted  nucleic acid-binding Zn-ribbon protein
MAEKEKKFRTKLTVKSQSQIGTFQRGDKQVPIYEVIAVNEQGTPVDKKLRTFHEELPVDVLEEYEVDPYLHKDYGQTYTLKKLSKGHASKKDVADLTSQITALANRLSAVEAEVQELRQKDKRGASLDEAASGDDPWNP